MASADGEAPATSEDARDTVLSIAKKFGFISDDVMREIGEWKPEIRDIIKESMLAKDELAGHHIKTYVRRVYAALRCTIYHVDDISC